MAILLQFPFNDQGRELVMMFNSCLDISANILIRYTMTSTLLELQWPVQSLRDPQV